MPFATVVRWQAMRGWRVGLCTERNDKKRKDGKGKPVRGKANVLRAFLFRLSLQLNQRLPNGMRAVRGGTVSDDGRPFVARVDDVNGGGKGTFSIAVSLHDLRHQLPGSY